MNMEYVIEFCILADVRKFAEAAELAYISSSSLSKHIKSLEDELGEKLFFRTAHSVVLTEFGESFLPYAKQIGEVHMRLNENLLSKTTSSDKRLRIGITPLVSMCAMIEKFPALSKQALGYSIEVFGHHNRHLRKLLDTDKCDFVITMGKRASDETDYDVIDYIEEDLCAVVSASSPLADRDNVSFSVLEKCSYIQIGQDNILFDLDLSAIEPDFIVPNYNTALDFIFRSGGYTVCPYSLAADCLPEQFTLLPIVPKCTARFYLMSNKLVQGDTRPLAAQKFLDTIQQTESLH